MAFPAGSGGKQILGFKLRTLQICVNLDNISNKSSNYFGEPSTDIGGHKQQHGRPMPRMGVQATQGEVGNCSKLDNFRGMCACKKNKKWMMFMWP